MLVSRADALVVTVWLMEIYPWVYSVKAVLREWEVGVDLDQT